MSAGIEIFRVTGEVAQYGIPTFLKLGRRAVGESRGAEHRPFPGLDGGSRLSYSCVASSACALAKAEAAVHAVGFVLLLLLLVVVSIADIRRVVGG